jgi:beta-glucosidase
MKKLIHLFIFIISCSLLFGQNKMNETDIKSFIKKMTIEQKIAQTCQLTLDAILVKDNVTGKISEPLQIDTLKLKELVLNHQIGSILNVSSHSLDLKTWRILIKQIHQFYLSKQTKIPVLYGIDAIHGANYIREATLFPQEIGIAASWNKLLAEEMGKITAYETRASGVPWNFSPVLDLGRQPLWSRFFETLGEDVVLASLMGKSIIKGYQGINLNSPYSVAACMKHFAGYSGSKSGRDRTDAWISERIMSDLYLPPFEEAVKQRIATAMINSGSVNGIPGHINKQLIQEKLKKEWEFKGFTVSDWEDIRMLHTLHHVASSHKEAIAMAVNAGLDMSMVPYYDNYYEYLKLYKANIEDHSISIQRLDEAVYRILWVKYELGLFENPYYDEKLYQDFGSEKHQTKALQLAEESITLLKNENKILPLSNQEKILLVGSAANNTIYLNGSWTHTWQGTDTSYKNQNALTLKEAMQKEFKYINYKLGYELKLTDNWESCSTIDTLGLFNEALKNDKIIICLGEMPATEKPGDCKSLNLCDEQQKLVQHLAKTNKPIILICLFGRPRIIREIVPHAKAIIQAYLPGDFGGIALTNLLIGKINPSGKLPYTYPKYDGVIEAYDRTYFDDKSGKKDSSAFDPQWEFGYGLSYTKFKYSNLVLSKNELNSSKDSITAKVLVENTGIEKGKEVIQWYIRDEYASVAPPIKRLKYFEKIELNPGEKKEVSFKIKKEHLTFISSENKTIVEPGNFKVIVNELQCTFKLLKP